MTSIATKYHLPQRLRATGIHFSLSLAVFLVLAYFIVFVWYPGHHFSVDGGWQGIRIMVGVDLVLGPLLTLLIFNPTKTRKAILFDFSVIATIQLSALIWGVYTVNIQKPVAISFWQDTFYPIREQAFDKQDIDLIQVQTMSKHSPPILYSKQSTDSVEAASYMAYTLVENLNPWDIHSLHKPLDEHWETVTETSIDIGELTLSSPHLAAQLEEYRNNSPINLESLVFIPFKGSYKNAILVFSDKGELLTYFSVDDD